MLQNKAEEVELFDRSVGSADYVEYGYYSSFGHRTLIRKLTKLAGDRLRRDCKGVDLGCGAGAFSRRFFNGAASDKRQVSNIAPICFE